MILKILLTAKCKKQFFFFFLVALTQLSKLVPNLTIIATASSVKFDVLRAHIHYLFEHDIDYIEDVKKYD